MATIASLDQRTRPARTGRLRVLAIASGGGHWVQLLRLRPALAECDVTYVSVDKCYRSEITGAGPGYFAVRLGKLFGMKTIWIDSIANVERLSLSGRQVEPYADLWLTQWSHLAGVGGPRYAGAML